MECIYLQVNAKLGDYLGLDFWTAKTHYGGTLQSAVDHILQLDPGKEDVLEVIPHVSAIAAAFGDPSNKYAKYISSREVDYAKQPFWFYDQQAAFTMSPVSHAGSSRAVQETEETASTIANESPFDRLCPAVLNGQDEIELDLGIYASCALLRPFYP